MNHPHKFRVWVESARFVYSDTKDQQLYVLGLAGTARKLGNSSAGEMYLAQQFTGRKDCKDIDIYEGDIVVSKIGTQYEVRYSADEAAYILATQTPGGGFVYLADFDGLNKVLGNTNEGLKGQGQCCDTPRGFVGGVCDYCGGTVMPEDRR